MKLFVDCNDANGINYSSGDSSRCVIFKYSGGIQCKGILFWVSGLRKKSISDKKALMRSIFEIAFY